MNEKYGQLKNSSDIYAQHLPLSARFQLFVDLVAIECWFFFILVSCRNRSIESLGKSAS